MTFIPPMLCEVLRDPSRLDDPCYVAEPKFDGQRAQVHVAGGRTVAAYSRRELDLLRHPGCAWLREVRWPVAEAVLAIRDEDVEICRAVQEGLRSRFAEPGRLCHLEKAIWQFARPSLPV